MYTEENEFDYDDYLEDKNDFNSNKNLFSKGNIIKAILVLLCIIIIIFLVFKIKNSNSSNNNSNNNSNNSSLVFNNNLSILKSVGESYFFNLGNVPTEVGEEKVVRVKELIDGNFITEIKDYNGSVCGYNTSYISVTKNSNDYMMKINLLCPSNEDSVIYYYDLDYNCLTCNGEDYISTNDKTEEPVEKDEEKTEEKEEVLVCGSFGEWTDEYIEDPTLERESRTVVIGFTQNITYGEWSEGTTSPITATDTLEVKTETKEETKTSYTSWSSYSKSKPSSKEGREIKTKTSSSQSCSTSTYTVERTSWDSSALKCTTSGIGKVVCTYEKETCKTVKTTYYKYRDTITETVNNTYYYSRQINKGELIYTNYILESEMPSGYQKLSGSEKTQYRYREACSK